MNKEEIYDEKVSPLITQIIGICHENKIAMLMSFYIPTEEDPDLECSTALLSDEFAPPQRMRDAYDLIMEGEQGNPMMMITTKDKDGQVINMTAVVQ